MKIFVQNKSIFKDYEIIEKFEAGIVLYGFEVKSIRASKVNLKGSYVSFEKGQILFVNAHVSPYQIANMPKDYLATRPRILLLQAREKRKLIGNLSAPKESEKRQKYQGNMTVLPLKMYEKHGKIKVEIALAKGLKKFDKREKIKKKDVEKKIRTGKWD